MELDFKITEDDMKALQEGYVVTWYHGEPPTQITVRMKYKKEGS